MPGSILGTEVRRVEDEELLLGKGTFVDNLQSQGVAHAVFVRSPFAHARITGIDAAEAAKADGVLGVFTADDLGREGLAELRRRQRAGAAGGAGGGQGRYVGDPVALVVAETRAQAMDAAELVDVDYDDLPAVTDMEEALADDAPLQFEAIGSNIATFRAAKDTADVLDDADHVARVRMVNQRIATAPIEGNAILVRPTDRRAWRRGSRPSTPTWPRDLLAKAIGVEAAHVRIVAPHVGGAFGGKAGTGSDHAAIAIAARRLGRPVKWVETRSEAMLSMQGRGQVQYAELGLKDDGTITGLRLRVLGECGAYAGFGGALAVGPTYMMAPGPYVVPRLRFDAIAVMTNTAPVGAFRGAGRPEAAAAIDRVIDVAAAGARHPARGDPAEEPDPEGRVPLPDADRHDLRHRRLRRSRSQEALRIADVDARPRRAAAPDRAPARPSCSASACRRTSRSPASAARSSARCRSTRTARPP